MRLINNAPIKSLLSLGLTKPIFGQAKTLLSHGERLKTSEQKLNFLSRCKRSNVFPTFIRNGININCNYLYPVNCSRNVQSSIYSLRRTALNQHIRLHYNDITLRKDSILESKDSLYSSVDYGTFHSIMCIFESYTGDIKAQHKFKLQQSFAWLREKYYPPKLPTDKQNGVILEPAVDRVTTINCDTISTDELSLLSLGRNYAISPTIDQKFVDNLQVDLAHGLLKVRQKLSSIPLAKNSESPPNQTGTLDVPTTSSAENEPNVNTKKSLRSVCPFPSTFTRAPDKCTPDIEDAMLDFNKFVLKIVGEQKPSSNLNRHQTTALKSLIKRTDLHISESDKGGEFVVTSPETHKKLTMQHLTENSVYMKMLPTKTVKGKTVEITDPTVSLLSQQVRRKNNQLIESSNKLWNDICQSHDFSEFDRLKLKVANCNLPCLYVTVKTHKNDSSEFKSHIHISRLKVRPIISCVDSPTEKLAWLVTQILSPLLKFVPSHLSSLYDHLNILRDISQDDLRGKKFFCADISSLYTNINISTCIDNLIDLATEYRDELDLMGLNLTDIHHILEHVFHNSWFTFNGVLYRQLDGLFMGMKPSPLGAIVRVYYLEKNSIYIDIHHLPIVYGRYVDDGFSLAKDENSALAIVNSITDQDPEGKIIWGEVSFPPDDNTYTSYLGSEVRVNNDGTLSTRLYRKKEKKNITIHNNSHHPRTVKTNTISNSYREARIVSSGEQELQHSVNIVDNLYRRNGYENPRQHEVAVRKTKSNSTSKAATTVTVSLPFVSDFVNNKIRNFIKSKSLPIRPVFKPGQKLSNILCSSRPYDRPKCYFNKCQICPLLTNKHCGIKNIVYKIVCKTNGCGKIYIGESLRSAHERLGEHLRYARYPCTPSNSDKALALHYKAEHAGLEPCLEFTILNIESNISRRKCSEALFIFKLKPALNLKDEMKYAERFLSGNIGNSDRTA